MCRNDFDWKFFNHSLLTITIVIIQTYYHWIFGDSFCAEKDNPLNILSNINTYTSMLANHYHAIDQQLDEQAQER